MPRIITYREALSEAFLQAFAGDPTLFMMGCGVTDHGGIFGTTLEVARRFGKERVFDVPLSENAIAGIAVGAAIVGRHPVVVHQRSDFLLLAMDQIINHAAKWKYMSGGKLSVPIVIRSIVGRGWGQAAQHSQNLHALFAHVPGLKVVLPSDPYDAKGLLLTSLKAKYPVLFMEHRWLHETTGDVPEEPYEIPFGKAVVKRQGNDLTIVAVSHMVVESLKAAATLEQEGISVEVCDLRTVSPVDWKTIAESVSKTGRLIVADTGWRSFGISAEIAAQVYEKIGEDLKAPVGRIALPDGPTPCTSALENLYYPGVDALVRTAKDLLSSREKNKPSTSRQKSLSSHASQREFVGPF